MKNSVYSHLCHLETNNLGEGTLLRGYFSVVHTLNAGTGGIAAIGLDPLVTELGLVLAESNTSDITVVVFMGESSKGAPSTSNVEQTIVGLEVEFLANHGQLVVLELLEAFLLFNVQNDARGIDHAGTKEPFVEVIAS